jgi:tellurite methyltransferase
VEATDERALWNEKFRSGSHASMEPDPFLVRAHRDYVQTLIAEGGERRALDLAGGTGRNAIFLAEQGWNVTLLDISDVGIERAQVEAAKRGLLIKVRNEDAAFADLGRAAFDLIAVFFFLERELFPDIREALKPGGLLISRTYTIEHPRLSGGRGPRHSMHLLKRNELLQVFSALEVLFYRETVIGKGVAELVARRP